MLSGPAGGAVGAGLLAAASGDGNALGLDMGGTSCDVCVIEGGRVGRTDGREFDGRPIQLPMVDVHTVGAGGGSIAWRDRRRRAAGRAALGRRRARARLLRQGRDRADRHRRQPAARLPRPRGRAGRAGSTLDRGRRRGRGRRARRAGSGSSRSRRPQGILEVANQEMVRALRVVTVERGIDPRGFALLPFGGAGPLHAAAIAAELGIERILCPRSGGVLSALGLVASERRRDTTRTVMLAGAELTAARIAADVAATVEALEPERAARRSRRSTSSATAASRSSCPSTARSTPSPGALIEDFAAEHERRYGYREDDGEVELVNVRARRPRAAGRASSCRAPDGAEPRRVDAPGVGSAASWVDDRGDRRRAAGRPRARRARASSSCPRRRCSLPAGWRAEVDALGTIVATQASGAQR